MTRTSTALTAFLAAALSLVALAPTPIAEAQTGDTCAEFSVGVLSNWWPANGTTNDVVGGHNAVLNGDAGFATGLVGEAFHLDGDVDYIHVPDHPSLDVGTGDFTVELWASFSSTDGEQVLAEKWVQNFDTGSIGWTLTKLEGNRIGFFTEGVGSAAGVSSQLNITLERWMHFGVVRRGFTVEMYVNGDFVGASDYPANNVANLDSASSLKFGHRGGASDTPGAQGTQGFYLDGRIDEVSLVVGHALTSEEIKAIYLTGSEGKCIDSFTDDDDSIFEADIEWLAAEGITKGCNPPTNDLFCPDDFVTRGQMAAFLHRALDDALSPTQSVEFVDDDSNTFEADIEWLGGTGVTKGCNPPTNDRYCPDDFVTRGQMAAFLVRALGYTDDGGRNLFTDDDGSTFEADIDRLAAAGVTKGCNPPVNNEFCPDDFVTRGQMAAFLHRALGS